MREARAQGCKALGLQVHMEGGCTKRQPLWEKTGQTQGSGSRDGHDHDQLGNPEGTSPWCSWTSTALCIQVHVLTATLLLAWDLYHSMVCMNVTSFPGLSLQLRS